LLIPASTDVIAGAIEAAERAPEELTAIINVMPAPPLPFVPVAHHGKLVTMILMCCVSDPDAGARAVAPFRALAEPIVDMVRPMRYPEVFPPEDPSFHPTAVGRTMFVERVDRQAAETILDFLRRSDASMRAAQVRVLGGAMARVPAGSTAFAHRQSPILINVAAFYNGPADRPARDAWTAELAAALHQGHDGMYVAFVNQEGQTSVRAAYPGATLDRLAAVKARYDPDNFFRRNHNITPALRGTQTPLGRHT